MLQHWSILQYFWSEFSYHLSLRFLFCLFLSWCFYTGFTVIGYNCDAIIGSSAVIITLEMMTEFFACLNDCVTDLYTCLCLKYSSVTACIYIILYYFQTTPHRRHCGCGPWARHIYPSLVLVQPRKNCPFITERLLMGRKRIKSNKIFKHLQPWITREK